MSNLANNLSVPSSILLQETGISCKSHRSSPNTYPIHLFSFFSPTPSIPPSFSPLLSLKVNWSSVCPLHPVMLCLNCSWRRPHPERTIKPLNILSGGQTERSLYHSPTPFAHLKSFNWLTEGGGFDPGGWWEIQIQSWGPKDSFFWRQLKGIV